MPVVTIIALPLWQRRVAQTGLVRTTCVDPLLRECRVTGRFVPLYVKLDATSHDCCALPNQPPIAGGVQLHPGTDPDGRLDVQLKRKRAVDAHAFR